MKYSYGEFKDFYFEISERTPKEKVRLHSHELFEIYYLTEGNCNYFIDDKAYTLEKGDAVFVPKGVVHKASYRFSTHSRMLINCSEDFIPSNMLERVRDGECFFRCGMNNELDTIFKRIKREYTDRDEYSYDMLKSYVVSLAVNIIRLSRGSKIPQKNELNCVERATEFIRDNYMEKICLSDVAKFCLVSREHLSRTFKQQMGIGFNEYLTRYRLNIAEAMLINHTGLSVSNIAYQCGFNDSNYFSTVFKKAYGISPTDKKRQNKK